jgi:hypothetical protein
LAEEKESKVTPTTAPVPNQTFLIKLPRFLSTLATLATLAALAHGTLPSDRLSGKPRSFDFSPAGVPGGVPEKKPKRRSALSKPGAKAQPAPTSLT